MPLYNFQPRFASDVQSGKKRQTIRRRRQRPTKPGETLYLYTGVRTKTVRKLGESLCTDVSPIEISDDAIKVSGEALPSDYLDEFARADGFADAADFFEFFRKTHGLSPSRVLNDLELIEWEPLRMNQFSLDYIGGLCPVQGAGKIADRRWFFYARGSSWEFYLAPSGVDPLDTEPMAQGAYGVWPQAGYMPLANARSIIYRLACEIEEAAL